MKRQLWILSGIIFGIQLQIAQVQFEVRQAFPNLSFVQPVDLQNAGDGTNRLFVVEQRGIIYVFPNDSNVTVTQRSTFLDIRDRVDDAGSEEGLLGLAFHPDYAANGYFYVNYTARNPNRSVISRFKVSDNDPNRAEPDSELVILTLPQPYSNHNAGALAFGPNDGYLYITTGDGGNFGDPQCNGQNLQTLLGSILRIDVDRRDPGMNYAIPPDNPFAGNTQGYREEIYAYGLRNPWRMSFDPVTGWLWAADVGQNSWEEIDLIQSGKNYGWAIMEGFHCYNSPWPCAPAFCDTTGRQLTPPLWEYGHNLGISITGGYVYRGPTVPELTGKYVYADFGSGRIWALEYDGVNPPTNTLLLDTQLNISSFGVDEQGELYICSYGNGRIYKFRPTVPVSLPADPPGKPTTFVLGQNYPNPFNATTTIPFWLKHSARVELSIFDGQGKLLETLVDDTVAAGSHTVIWNGTATGREVPSGTYFYRLKVDGKVVQSRSMVLTR